MAHVYDKCPETRIEYHLCPCALCDEARVKTQILLASKGKEIPQWLQDATGMKERTPEQLRMFRRALEWL